MAFQTPITAKSALEAVQRHDYALPAIQREFVWSTDQICMLFDSLLRGYPIGSFLFWKVKAENSQKFVFYDFIRAYHQRNSPHCQTLALAAPRDLTAILDGQQRLTALNIGLFGSHAEKLPRKHWNNAAAYPVKELYLDLNHEADDEELGFFYKFRFLTAAEASSPSDGEHWYRVKEVIQLEDGLPMMKYVQQNELDEPAYTALYQLHHAVHAEPAISFYEEGNQELDDVLHIFIRLNSQGTPLSHSDLLLSIGLHTFRHSCASIMFRRGVPKEAIRRLLGHHSWDFTAGTYLHLGDDDLPDGSVVDDLTATAVAKEGVTALQA
jgi:hypothetical protein